MGFEQFTPNQYVADCWFVAPGDCYDDLYEDFLVDKTQRPSQYEHYNEGEHVAINHGSHRLPQSGWFDSNIVPVPSASISYSFWISNVVFDEYGLYDGLSYNLDGQFSRITTPVYKFEYNGETHYLKNISYPLDRNKS